MRVAGVGGRVIFDQIAGEQDLFLWQPDDGVAQGVPRTRVANLHLERLQVQRQIALENERRPSQPGNRLHRIEQARKAFNFGLHVLCTTFGDQVPRAATADDFLRAFGEIGRSAEHAHGVVVR